MEEPTVLTPLVGVQNGLSSLVGSVESESSPVSWPPVASSRAGNLRKRLTSFVRRREHGQVDERPLGAMAVCFVTYFNVCGGPWGTELIVSTAGPLPGLSGILVVATLYSLPLALITAELSSAYPDDGGYSIWVAEAYGEFWGFQESYWSWISGVVDNAAYPVLAYQTLIKLLGPNNILSRTFSPYVLKLLISGLFTLPNLVFTNHFGSGMGILAMCVFMPFFVMSLNVFVPLSSTSYNGPKHWDVILQTADDVALGDFTDLVAILYWNFSGFDCISTCAGEVNNPAKSYSRGLLLALLLVVLTYMLPLVLLSVVDKPSWTTWGEGSYATIAEEQVGHWMALWIVVASCLGNAGMHMAEMFEDSWQLCGMAQAGLAPAVFARRHSTLKTPWVAVLFSLVIINAIIVMDFLSILAITNFFSILSALLELLAYYKLRVTKPDLPRPYKVPISSTGGVALFLTVPVCLGSVILVSSLFNDVFTVCATVAGLLAGLALYWVMKKSGNIDYSYQQL